MATRREVLKLKMGISRTSSALMPIDEYVAHDLLAWYAPLTKSHLCICQDELSLTRARSPLLVHRCFGKGQW